MVRLITMLCTIAQREITMTLIAGVHDALKAITNGPN